jgi:hypothetical protein
MQMIDNYGHPRSTYYIELNAQQAQHHQSIVTIVLQWTNPLEDTVIVAIRLTAHASKMLLHK